MRASAGSRESAWSPSAKAAAAPRTTFIGNCPASAPVLPPPGAGRGRRAYAVLLFTLLVVLKETARTVFNVSGPE